MNPQQKHIEILANCVYWYEVQMHLDINCNGMREAAPVRLPCKCISLHEKNVHIEYFDPSEATRITRIVQKDRLFDSPLSHASQISDLQNQIKDLQGQVDELTARNVKLHEKVKLRDKQHLWWMEQWMEDKNTDVKKYKFKAEEARIDLMGNDEDTYICSECKIPLTTVRPGKRICNNTNCKLNN